MLPGRGQQLLLVLETVFPRIRPIMMGIIHYQDAPREKIDKRQSAWLALHRMPSASMICTAMSGSGVWIGTGIILLAASRILLVLHQARTGSIVAAAGTTARTYAAQHIATTSALTTGITAWDSASSGRIELLFGVASATKLPEREHPQVLTDIHPFKWLAVTLVT